jgi:hypothetical protein
MTLDDIMPRILARCRPAPGGCLEWTGACTGSGRPALKHHGRTVYVARLVLRAALGRPLKPQMLACHTCDNPRCVEPSHLHEGDHARNLRDAWARKRRTRPRTFTEA